MNSKIGVIGLGVMGQNLALNLLEREQAIVAFDVSPMQRDKLSQINTYDGLHLAADYHDFLAKLPSPRMILVLVPAGEPLRQVIDSLIASGIAPEDAVVDCGNSDWQQSFANQQATAGKLQFFTMGISGGAEGARTGPAMMASGEQASWQPWLPLFDRICAKADDGEGCFSYVGTGVSGHFVKMVHNGIEYAVMQLLAEWFDIAQHCDVSGLSFAEQLRHVNDYPILNGYLVEISQHIASLTTSDGQSIVSFIDDKAGQKGTGAWSVRDAASLGVAVPAIQAALNARIMSNQVRREGVVSAASAISVSVESVVSAFASACEAAFIQGLDLIATASEQYQWHIDLPTVVKGWRAGCIIRNQGLNALANRLTTTSISELKLELAECVLAQPALKQVAVAAVSAGVNSDVLYSTLSYASLLNRSRHATALVQAQRDYFGEHGVLWLDGSKGHLADKVGVFQKVK